LIAERDFSSRRRPRDRRAGDLVALALAALLLAASAYAAVSASEDARQAQASLDNVRRDIAAATARMKELQAAAGGEGGLGARAVWSIEAPPPRVVAAIGEMLPRDVRLDALVLRYGAQLEVEMTLTARTAEEYDRFLRALEASPAFDRIVLGEETRTDAVRASVRAHYQANGGS